MTQRRWKLSSVQRADMWSRWKAGESLNAIGRALGKDKQVIHFLLARHGGIAPSVRRRSRHALTLAEREDISRGIASGCSLRDIAQQLSRARSTVSREVARHGGRAQYRANEADSQAWQSALRPKVCRLALREKLRTLVASKLMRDWSPEQISGWLKRQYPNDESLRVSHETIYRTLFLQARGALKQELIQHLRSKRLDPPLAARQRSRTLPRQDRRCDFHPRAACGSGRSCHPRALGGRSVARCGQQPRGHAGGTSFTLLHAGQGARQGHGNGGGRSEPAGARTSGDVATFADLGPRVGDGPAQKLHHGYGCTGLLLRSAKSLAARLERKHQRVIAAIPTEEGGSVLLLPVGARRDRIASESTATKNIGISNSGG
jgi:DNA-binding CsgD family transcriptional regulator